QKYQTSEMIFGFQQNELYSQIYHLQKNNSQILLQELQFAYLQIDALKSRNSPKQKNIWLKLKRLLGFAKS
ncbi:MAG: glycosyltransferase family 2 protein, partial [Cyanobacteria bacterium J06632_19]